MIFPTYMIKRAWHPPITPYYHVNNFLFFYFLEAENLFLEDKCHLVKMADTPKIDCLKNLMCKTK